MAGRHPHRVGQPVVVQRVVVVRKTTAIEQQRVRPDRKLAQALLDRNPLIERVARAHEEHLQTSTTVETVLAAQGIEFKVVHKFTRHHARWADLVVTVGGDGTFLRASHCIDGGPGDDGVPMLGVNSATSSSVGYFCAATAQSFAQVLADLRSGVRRSEGLWRLQVEVAGNRVPDLALNDVLIAHQKPAETTRYTLQVGEQVQDQKSSGIWVATPAGSTAAIRAAGGSLLPIDARTLQYRVREPMLWGLRGTPMVGGEVPEGLDVVSRMTHGKLYLDGAHLELRFGFGDRLRIRPSERPMPWIPPLGLAERRQALWSGRPADGSASTEGAVSSANAST